MSNNRPFQAVTKVIQDRLVELDAPLGYITENHLKWIRGYIYWKFNTKQVMFYLDFNSNPRVLTVVPILPDGKIFNIYQWLRIMLSMFRDKNITKPLLHPKFWPSALEIPEWKIRLRRTIDHSKKALS